jgi:hypothetical protein
MNLNQDPNHIQHLLSLPKRLGELAANLAPKHQHPAQPKSPLSAILEHLNTPRSPREKAMDSLKSHEFIMND